MHTVSAFYGNDVASAAADTVLSAVQDQCFPTQNSRIFPPTNRQLLAGFGGGVSLTLAKLDSASLNLNGRPMIYPLDSSQAGGNLPGYIFFGERGLTLPGLEQIGVLVSRAVAAAADVYAFLWHTQRYTMAPPGPTKTVRCTAAVVLAEGTWTIGNLTFDAALSEGRYAIVGMAAQGTNLLSARLVFPNQIDRPGVLGVDAVSQYVLPNWRMGGSGLYGTFQNYNPPQVEMLGIGAGTTQDVYLDLVKVG